MKMKILKFLSVIFQTFGIGALGLYFYNYFTLKGKYDPMPKEVTSNLNLYLLIGIACIILYLITFVLIKFMNKINIEEQTEQLSLNLEDNYINTNQDTQSNAINSSNEYVNYSTANNNLNYINTRKIEEILLRIESKLDSRLMSNKSERDIPIIRQKSCPNCNSIVDNNAFICLHCGFLLKEMHNEEKIDNKEVVDLVNDEYSYTKQNVVENLNENTSYNTTQLNNSYDYNTYETVTDNYNPTSVEYDNAYETRNYGNEYVKEDGNNYEYSTVLKILVGIFVVLLLIFGGKYLINSTRRTNMESEERINEFYITANDLITEIKESYNDSKIKLNKNAVYFTLRSLGHTSAVYDSEKSYVAINKNTGNIYISLIGINEYETYSISLVEKDEFDKGDILKNTAVVAPIDDMILIGNDNSVTIYYKN